MPIYVPKTAEVKAAIITAVAGAPTHVSATVTDDQGNASTVSVPASAVAGDLVVYNADGTLPAVADGKSFLSATDATAEYIKVA